MGWDTSNTRVICPDCGSLLQVRKGKHGEFYGCNNYPRCLHTGKVGKNGEYVAKDSKAVREARITAHKVFDTTWKDKRVFNNRYEAYGWLARTMGMPCRKAHIRFFDERQCAKVVHESKMLLDAEYRKKNTVTTVNVFGVKVQRTLSFSESEKRGLNG